MFATSRVTGIDIDFSVENDLVAIRIGNKFKLSRPLTPGGLVNLAKGNIAHASIIGRRPGELITTDRGLKCWIEDPSLSDYIRHSRRIVTPVRMPHNDLN